MPEAHETLVDTDRIAELVAAGLDRGADDIRARVLRVTNVHPATPPETEESLRRFVPFALQVSVGPGAEGELIVLTPIPLEGYGLPGEAAELLAPGVIREAQTLMDQRTGNAGRRADSFGSLDEALDPPDSQRP